MRVRRTVQLGLALPYQLSRAQEKESPSQQCIRELGMGEPFSGWPGSPQEDGGGKAGQAGRQKDCEWGTLYLRKRKLLLF